MKKHLITLTGTLLLTAGAYAQPSAWVNCATGGSATITWDGGGADENWTTAANWSGDVVPDCNDNVVFNNTSSKICRINSGVTVRDITMNSNYGGRLIIESSGSIAAEDIAITGSTLIARSNSGMLKANTLNVSDNGYASLNQAEVFGVFTVGAAGYTVFNSYGSLDAGSMVIGNHGFFRAPGDYLLNPDAKVIVRGSFQRNKVSSFDHNEGLFEFITTNNVGINLSSGVGQNNGRTVFYNLVMNATGTGDNFQIQHTDTLVVANRLTIENGEFRDGGGSNAFVVIEDTLQYNGVGGNGSQATFIVRGPKTCDLFLSAEDVAAGTSKLFMMNKAVIRKGTASSINSRFELILENGADVSFGDAVDVTQKKSLDIRTGASIALPASNTFSLENANLFVRGTVDPGNGTFAFTGSSNTSYDLYGGSADFYNVIMNKGTAGTNDPGNVRPLTINGGGVLRVNNDLTFEEVDWREGSLNTIIEVGGDWIVSANMTNNTSGTNNGMIIRFVGGNNSKLQSDGLLIGDCDIQINKDDASDVVTVTGSLQEIGNDASRVTVTKGKLAFDGTRNAILRCSREPGLTVGADGQLVAPDDDELNITGSWNFAGQSSLDAQSGTIVVSSGNAKNFNHNNNSITFNNIRFARASGSADIDWGHFALQNSDEIYVKGNFEIASTGIRVRYVSVKIEGNLTTVAGTSNKSSLQEVIFVGSNNQTITCGDADEISEFVEINKTGGKVTLGADLLLNNLKLTSGNLVPSTYLLTVSGGNSAITGGSSSSFVDGKLRRIGTAIWSGGITLPIGKGSAYRPITLASTVSNTNSWDAEYFAADPTVAFGSTVNSPLDAVSSNEYWTLVRNTGSSNTTVGLSTNGSSFTDADTRVARWNAGTTSWDNFGPGTGAASGFVTSSSTISATGTYNFTLGVDNPAPISLVNGEQVSGQEIAPGKNQQQAAPAVAQQAVAFSVFPNPVVETLNFALSGADKGSVVLSDMSGKVIGIFNVADTRSISMRNLAAGVYFATFTDGVNRITHRVVRN